MRYWRNRLRNRHPGCPLEIGHEDFGPLLDGTWTIASTANSNGNYSIRLNGLAVTEAVNMEVWGGGVLYVVNVWGVGTSGSLTLASAPVCREAPVDSKHIG